MTMTVSDVFGLIVRALGLWSLFRAFSEGFSALEFQFGMSASRYAAAGGIYLVLGAGLVMLADPITRLVYRRDR
jgi:hypothetical protein